MGTIFLKFVKVGRYGQGRSSDHWAVEILHEMNYVRYRTYKYIYHTHLVHSISVCWSISLQSCGLCYSLS